MAPRFRFLLAALLLSALALNGVRDVHAQETIVVSAEGLADPNAPQYARDRGLLVDALREDARRQLVEKAVGVFVDSQTLTQNYTLISDRVLTRSSGLIRTIINESSPWIGKDGFAHILLKGEVYVGKVETLLGEISREQRVALIKERGNPRISVAIMVRDADRGSNTPPRQSPIAENVLKARVAGFGYRVWSEDLSASLRMDLVERSQMTGRSDLTVSVAQNKAADFTILGEAKLKENTVQLRQAGISATTYALTSYTTKVVNNTSGEEVYYNTKTPAGVTWNDEDLALREIGRIIGREFSVEFFERIVNARSRIFQLQVLGLPDYDTGVLMRKEFLGLRPVLNADFRSFDASGLSLYEVEFSGGRQDFARLVNDTVVRPLNDKIGERVFRLTSTAGALVRIEYADPSGAIDVYQALQARPPASVATASPERLATLVQSEELRASVTAMNPAAEDLEIMEAGDGQTLDAIDTF
jgi:serine/threonine-protein kinase